jgi:drug/metabolite transporter (DMT)-like permease
MHKSEATATTRVHQALFVTMMVWGVNLSAVKGLTENLDLMLVASVRMVLASVVLAVLTFTFGQRNQKWTPRKWWLLLLAAFFLVYSQQIAFAEGLFRTSATNAALVMALGPAVSLSLETLIFKRLITRRKMYGIAFALAGVSVVILNRPMASLTAAAWGDVWIFVSVLAFALGGLCIQRLTQDNAPLSVSFVAHVAGALMLCLHTAFLVTDPIQQIFKMTTWQWMLAAFSAILATGIGSVVWSRGIATIGVGRTASYISWVPIFGVAFGALFFSEPVTIWHAFGMVAVLAGTTLIVRR